MRSSSFTILMIAMLLIIILLALVVIIGLAITINYGDAPQEETGAIHTFVLWSEYIMERIIQALQDFLDFILHQIEQLSKSI
ncbi:MAG TPA: hypothetical protein PLM96_05135 [Methanoregulaceae archaeon]|nr:hypothetical protein [Methanolinea sp.]MDD3090259.1 hypothetical protein [Methanoregulaceae archaeon]MDD5047320.1 hypothetical protein [Methanoregulaceae archaeon]MDD5684452.1 hypothetical protein [Methanoregulaceae archaeon]HOP67159.1 hypothetical protein [Methanoregulaceae archaeon]